MEAKKLSPFDIIQGLINGKEWQEEYKNIYCPWLTNKYFSNAKEFIFAAVIADGIEDPKMNYYFWSSIIPKKMKYIKWIKNLEINNEQIYNIACYYNISREKAAQYIKFLTEEDCNFLKLYMEK